jgi:hypothetical protein
MLTSFCGSAAGTDPGARLSSVVLFKSAIDDGKPDPRFCRSRCRGANAGYIVFLIQSFNGPLPCPDNSWFRSIGLHSC